MRTSIVPGLAVLALGAVLVLVAKANWHDASRLNQFNLLLVIVAALAAFAFPIAIYSVRSRVERLRTPRELQRSGEILKLLKPLTQSQPVPEVTIGYQPEYDAEAKDFASKIGFVLTAAGWKVRETNSPGEGPFTGIRLVTYGGPTEQSLTEVHASRRAALKQSLKLMKERCEVFPNASRDNRTVGVLIVGPKSPDYPVTTEKCIERESEDGRFAGGSSPTR